jgi:hypothetical protein
MDNGIVTLKEDLSKLIAQMKEEAAFVVCVAAGAWMLSFSPQ